MEDSNERIIEEKPDGLYIDGEQVENYKDGYYHVFEDAYNYPDCDTIITYSRRGPGKTTSALIGAILRNKVVVYIRRTNTDIKMMSTGSEMNLSPWATVNRILGTNYVMLPVKGKDGMARVVSLNESGEEVGEPIAYVLSMALSTTRGFDISDKADIVLIDEFVPSRGAVVRHAEGTQSLDIIMTIIRDRHERNLPDIKMWLFSNCDYLACPITREFGIIDDIYELSASGERFLHLPDKGIVIHHILKDDYPNTINLRLMRFMKGTDWYKRNIEGNFDEDFSNIEKKTSVKNYACLAKLVYNKNIAYVLYRNSDQSYYITYDFDARVKTSIPTYNFDNENAIRLFYNSNLYMSILSKLMYDKCKFSNYSLFDLIKRYRDIFSTKIY